MLGPPGGHLSADEAGGRVPLAGQGAQRGRLSAAGGVSSQGFANMRQRSTFQDCPASCAPLACSLPPARLSHCFTCTANVPGRQKGAKCSEIAIQHCPGAPQARSYDEASASPLGYYLRCGTMRSDVRYECLARKSLLSWRLDPPLSHAPCRHAQTRALSHPLPVLRAR